MARYYDNPKFYFVGGQVKESETDKACLQRKVPNEITASLLPDSLEKLGTFEDVADGREDTLLSLTLYRGEVMGEIKPNHDVSEIGYFDSLVDPTKVSVIAVTKILPFLQGKKRIN